MLSFAMNIIAYTKPRRKKIDSVDANNNDADHPAQIDQHKSFVVCCRPLRICI